jgi:quercetin 2,3-dioxygenase
MRVVGFIFSLIILLVAVTFRWLRESVIFPNAFFSAVSTVQHNAIRMNLITPRSLLQRRLVKPHRQGDALIHQPIGSGGMSEFMPFLLLDDVETQGRTDGFGDHPHSGQETMTYMLEGQLVHQDSKGNHGVLNAGDLQAMRAGRGILHNETPVEDPVTNRTLGIQLWVALPHANLNDEPGYQDILSKDMPVALPSPGVNVRVITGESFDKKAPMLTRAPVWYFDVSLDQGGKVAVPIPKHFNVFAHILQGKPQVAGQEGQPHEAFFFKRDGEAVELENTRQAPARLLLIAGDPLEGQEVHRMGPFVSTSSLGIQKTIFDYRSGKNGFKDAHAWESEPVHAS